MWKVGEGVFCVNSERRATGIKWVIGKSDH